MQRYEPIRPIDEESTARSMADADRLRARWDDLRAAVGEDRVRVAVDGERWRAAVETGVIERLYEVSRGVTEAIVRSGLEADEALELDADVYNQIAAHQHAEMVVVDAVRQERPLTTSLIRELHAAVTHAQAHYTAYDQFGRAFRRSLAHGEYKDHDNHVRLPDGTVHEYAPATQVASELDRLVGMVAEATRAHEHPVRLAAFAHHRFTQIHPFADGNGRTARLLATFLLVRGGYLPLIVQRQERDRYLRALQEADDESLIALVDFCVTTQREGVVRLEHVVFEPSPASDLAVLSTALADYAARRRAARPPRLDVSKDVLMPVGEKVARLVSDALERALAPFALQGFDVDVTQARPQLLPLERPFTDIVELAGLQRRPVGSIARLEVRFRIGDSDPTIADVGVVPLAVSGDDDVALVLVERVEDVAGTRTSLLPASLESFNEREVRRWVDDWLGRMLVDYAQRL